MLRRLWQTYVRWPLQRVYRGYDDRAAWSLDWYLARWLPDVLRRIKATNTHPAGMSMEEWHEKLDAMIDAFELIERDTWFGQEEHDEQQRRIRRGLGAFGVWFQHLWT